MSQAQVTQLELANAEAIALATTDDDELLDMLEAEADETPGPLRCSDVFDSYEALSQLEYALQTIHWNSGDETPSYLEALSFDLKAACVLKTPFLQHAKTRIAELGTEITNDRDLHAIFMGVLEVALSYKHAEFNPDQLQRFRDHRTNTDIDDEGFIVDAEGNRIYR